jgi:hypothetical protein
MRLKLKCGIFLIRTGENDLVGLNSPGLGGRRKIYLTENFFQFGETVLEVDIVGALKAGECPAISL